MIVKGGQKAIEELLEKSDEKRAAFLLGKTEQGVTMVFLFHDG